MIHRKIRRGEEKVLSYTRIKIHNKKRTNKATRENALSPISENNEIKKSRFLLFILISGVNFDGTNGTPSTSPPPEKNLATPLCQLELFLSRFLK